MTVIDALVVTLGIDSKGLDKSAPVAAKKLKDLESQSDKTEKGIKKLGAASKETGEGFSDLTRAAAGFLAIIGGISAIKGMVSDFIETNAQLNRLSQNLGIGVSEISAWGQAVEQSGGSASGLQGTLDMLSKAQTQLKLTGESSLIPYLSMLGVSLVDVNNKALSATDDLSAIAEGVGRATARGMSRPDANNVLRAMGIDQGTANLLLKSRGERELLIKRIKETTAAQDAQGESAQKFKTKLVQLQEKFEAFGRSLFMQAAPALEKILDWLLKLGDWVTQNSQVVSDFLKIVAVGLGAIAIAAAPISLVTAAIVGLAAGIALLWQDYQTWKRGGDSLINWAKWEPEITAAKKGLDALNNTLGTTIEFLKVMGDTGVGNAIKERLGFSYTDLAGKYHRGGNQATTSAAQGSISDRAKAQAARVSKMTGIPADIVYAAFQHETGGFTNRGATSLHNFAGVNVPGGKGQDYRNFKSDDEFGNYYAYLMRQGGRYDAARSAKTPEAFAAALKAGGYYTGSQSDYGKDMRAWMGTPGASAAAGASGSSSVNWDRYLHIGEINIQTQATDAPGIAKDIHSSLQDYLFTSQANSGLSH